ncbi:hypothetical protein [Calothrix sp. NIES-3974]|uniref:hypothetical protein n=1 Tax=Calothrix sp. NIES-3974 TaxID=2005462 RepID=UPI000B60765C|nr:hypothetical protein [Calothrix sp. NIES-3974]BAZ06319.1 hypothetical protein NIES3974_29770 [Calothrix sp. NIES-3974]
MSEKTIENYGKGFLVMILPVSFLVIFLAVTWRILLALTMVIMGFNLWQRYRWEQWCYQVNPMFHQIIERNQGRVTPMELAANGKFSGDVAKRYLDTKAHEFGANILNQEDGSKVYYFMTANVISDIFDSSEPVAKIPGKKVANSGNLLLAAPEKTPAVETQTTATLTMPMQHTEVEEQVEVEETAPPVTETKKAIAEQLVFGSLIQSELAKRLNVYSSTVFKRRGDPDFPEWSRNRDPDGIAWRYDRKSKEFFPLEDKA